MVLFQAPFVFHLPTHSFIHSLVICPLVYLFVSFLFTCLPVGLFVYLFIYLFIYLFVVCSFIYLFILLLILTAFKLFILCIYLFVCSSFHQSTRSPAHSSIYLFIYLGLALTHPFIQSFFPSHIHSFILEFAPVFSNSRQLSPIRTYSLPSLILHPASSLIMLVLKAMVRSVSNFYAVIYVGQH